MKTKCLNFNQMLFINFLIYIFNYWRLTLQFNVLSHFRLNRYFAQIFQLIIIIS
jgi:hypothetical protein